MLYILTGQLPKELENKSVRIMTYSVLICYWSTTKYTKISVGKIGTLD